MGYGPQSRIVRPRRLFWLLWTYIANYSDKPFRVEAESPEDACRQLYGIYSDDFAAKATVYVFEHEPVLVKKGPGAQ